MTLPLRPVVMGYLAHEYSTITFGYNVDFGLHTLVVVMSGKPQGSFLFVMNNLKREICMKFEYISKQVYFQLSDIEMKLHGYMTGIC